MKMANLLLNNKIDGFKQYIKKARDMGMLEYVISDIFQKFMVFVGGFIIVRLLTKEAYGSYTYLTNLLSVFTIFGDLGISSAVLQYASINHDNENKKMSFIRYANKMLFGVSFLSVFIVLIGSYVYRFKIDGVQGLFRFMMILPLFNNEVMFCQSLLRVELRNKEFARINILNTVLHYIALIGLSYVWGLKGAIAAAYPQNIIILAVYYFTLKPILRIKGEISLTKEEKRSFWKFALLMQVNQTSLALLNYLDIYCLGALVKQPEVIADYKVASTIPTALYFIPKSILFFLVPLFGRNRKDMGWVKKTFMRTLLCNALLCGAVSIVMAIIARPLIELIYGTQYANATQCFLILLIGFFAYGVIQIPASNVLSVFEKLKIVLIMSISGALLNIVLNVLLINLMGSVGAAIATVASHVFIGGVLTAYMIYFLRKHKSVKMDG